MTLSHCQQYAHPNRSILPASCPNLQIPRSVGWPEAYNGFEPSQPPIGPLTKPQEGCRLNTEGRCWRGANRGLPLAASPTHRGRNLLPLFRLAAGEPYLPAVVRQGARLDAVVLTAASRSLSRKMLPDATLTPVQSRS